MSILPDYQHYNGYHWETGSVHNLYAYRKVLAPHTGKPYSEPLLLGVSGGIVMGYFTFAYEGYDPQCNILTRNTFDPMETMLARLGVVQNLAQTAKPDKAVSNLLNALADGTPAIVWADHASLPYNGHSVSAGWWGANPIVVWGYDKPNDQVWIADRAGAPLQITTTHLANARGRIKSDKHRLLTLDMPDPEKLASAVRLGIRDCINLFTEKPPKGAASNFGLAAYRFWADMLTTAKDRRSWAKVFPPGIALYSALTFAYRMAFLHGKDLRADGERGAYATFLDEAALIVGRPALHAVAQQFRGSAVEWTKLSQVLLPEQIAPLAQARQLMWRRHEAFHTRGNAALSEMREIDRQRDVLRQAIVEDFPLTEAEAATLRGQISDQVMRIHDTEQTAIAALKEAIA